MPRRLMALLVCSLALLAAGRCDAGFTISDLGPLGDASAGITGINAGGIVAGTVYGPNGPVAVVSSPTGTLQPLNLQPLPAGSSYANSISDKGTVVGTYFSTVDHTYHAFQFSDGKATDLGANALASPGRVNAYGVAISGSGAIVGTAYSSNGTSTPFRTQGVTPTITLPDGSLVGRASGVSDAGTVIGSYTDTHGTSHVFTIGSNQATAGDPLVGVVKSGFGTNFYGIAIDARGDLTGNGDFNGQQHAFVLSGSTFHDIGTTGSFTSSRSTAMNDSGLVVGQLDGIGTVSHAFVWAPPGMSPQASGLFDLNSLLSAADRQVWTLSAATGINDSNQICGQGYVNGVLHGFVLTPTLDSILGPTSVPAPPSAVMALAGLGIAGGWYRLRRGRTAARGSA